MGSTKDMCSRVIVHVGVNSTSITLQRLYTFINVNKVNMMITHVDLLQVWAYEHISVIRPVGLQRVRDEPIDVALVC